MQINICKWLTRDHQLESTQLCSIKKKIKIFGHRTHRYFMEYEKINKICWKKMNSGTYVFMAGFLGIQFLWLADCTARKNPEAIFLLRNNTFQHKNIIYVEKYAGFLFKKIKHSKSKHWASQVARWVKNPPAVQQTEDPGGSWFDPWVGKIPWRRKWQVTLVFLPGKSHWQRSLEGYSP